MRVSLSTYRSRGRVEPAVGLAVRVSAPPECAAAEDLMRWSRAA